MRALATTSRSLRCTGVAKIGKPGLVVVEGLAADVADWTAQIKSLAWQKISVKSTHTVMRPSTATVAGTDAASATAWVESQRKFAHFTVLSPLAEARWPTMGQLLECVRAHPTVLEAVREALGWREGQQSVPSEEGAAEDETNSDDEAQPAAPSRLSSSSSAPQSLATSAPAPTPAPVAARNKRHVKEEEKKLARQMAQVQIGNSTSAAAATSVAIANSGDPLKSDLGCVEVMKLPASSSASAAAAAAGAPLQSLRVHIRAYPNSSCSEVLHLGVFGEVLHLSLAAPPREGAANIAAVKLLSQVLGLAQAQVQVVAGDKGRDKVLLLTHVKSAADVCDKLRRINAQCDAPTVFK